MRPLESLGKDTSSWNSRLLQTDVSSCSHETSSRLKSCLRAWRNVGLQYRWITIGDVMTRWFKGELFESSAIEIIALLSWLLSFLTAKFTLYYLSGCLFWVMLTSCFLVWHFHLGSVPENLNCSNIFGIYQFGIEVLTWIVVTFQWRITRIECLVFFKCFDLY